MTSPMSCGRARSACERGRRGPRLSALGIAIGVASMVAVLGISESSKADLLAQLDKLGTNLLRVAPGPVVHGRRGGAAGGRGADAAARERGRGGRRDGGRLRPDRAPQPVHQRGRDRRHRRRRRRSRAARDGRRDAAPRHASSTPPPGATRRSCSAPRRPNTLGIDDAGARVWIAERWFTVVGILEPGHARRRARHRGADRLRRRRDRSSARRATRRTVYVRADQDRVERRARPARPHGEPASARRRSTSRAPPTRSRPAPRPRPRSPRCSSASAPSRCSSAASASPT